MAKSLKKPVSLIESYHSLNAIDGDNNHKTKPKSYSLPIEMHDWLVAESARKTVDEGRRVSASQLLADIVNEFRSR